MQGEQAQILVIAFFRRTGKQYGPILYCIRFRVWQKCCTDGFDVQPWHLPSSFPQRPHCVINRDASTKDWLAKTDDQRSLLRPEDLMGRKSSSSMMDFEQGVMLTCPFVYFFLYISIDDIVSYKTFMLIHLLSRACQCMKQKK